MKALESGFAARLASDNFTRLLLLELLLETTYRYAFWPAPVTWNGQTYEPTSGAWTEQQETLEPEAPTPQLTLQNLDGVVGLRVDLLQSGKDVRGKKARLIITDPIAAATVPTPAGSWLEETQFIENYSRADTSAVVFELGVWPAVLVRSPWREVGLARCPWIYKGAHCGFVSLPDGSDVAKCAKTVEDCERHFPGLPLRTGQFFARDVIPAVIEV